MSKYNDKTVLVVDDINDTGTTLQGISAVITNYVDQISNKMAYAHQDIKYATLFDKESSSFTNVEFTANNVLPDQERWIVFPYEEGWR